MALTPRQKQLVAEARKMKAEGKLPTLTPKRQQELIDMAMARKTTPTIPPTPTPRAPARQARTPVSPKRRVGAIERMRVTPPTETIISRGATLSGLARQHGTTVAELMRLNPQIRDPNLIFAGAKLKLPGTDVPATTPRVDPVIDPTVKPEVGVPAVDPVIDPVTDPVIDPAVDPKQKAIDSVQQQLEEFEKMQEADLKRGDDVPVRPRVYLDKIKEMLKKPEDVRRPDLAAEFETLRAKYQVDPLKGQLSSVNKQVADLMTLAERAVTEEEKRLAPMAVVRLKQQRMGEDFNSKLTALNLQRKTIIDELNSKYDTIDNIMQLKKEDYRMARDAFEREFNRQLTFHRLLVGEEKWQYEQDIRQITREDQAAERAKRTSFTNWQVTSGIIQENLRLGILPSFAELPEEVKTSLRRLELQAGLPSGFTENTIGLIQKVAPEKEVIQRMVWPDKSKVTIMYDDGTSSIIDTGIPPGAVDELVNLTPTQRRWAEVRGIDLNTPEGRRRVLEAFTPLRKEEERKAITRLRRELVEEIQPKIEEVRKQYEETLRKRGWFGWDWLAKDEPFDDEKFQRLLKKQGLDVETIDNYFVEQGVDPDEIWDRE